MFQLNEFISSYLGLRYNEHSCSQISLSLSSVSISKKTRENPNWIHSMFPNYPVTVYAPLSSLVDWTGGPPYYAMLPSSIMIKSSHFKKQTTQDSTSIVSIRFLKYVANG